MRLQELKENIIVIGLCGEDKVRINKVDFISDEAANVIGTCSDGHIYSGCIFAEDAEKFRIVATQTGWDFSADAASYKRISEAYRIQLAFQFDPWLAIRSSKIQPLPHQISAVYEHMLSRQPLRFILADDPGAGKTIMSGLLIKELMLRGDVRRCLIVSPGSLTEQWQEELAAKFNLRFKILTNEEIEASLTNVFDDVCYCIARLDKLARNDSLRDKLANSTWDLVICDEAHKMSARWYGDKLDVTKRFSLGEILSRITRHLLLLTATPHNGDNSSFELFLSLVDGDRFAQMKTSQRRSIDNSDLADIMLRRVKEELVEFNGTPLFPERIAKTIAYDLSDEEQMLYEQVSTYVTEEFNRAQSIQNGKMTTVGFALTILQRRLASSPEAIYLSLHRRREKLEQILGNYKFNKFQTETHYITDDDWDDDEYTADERESQEDELVDQTTASRTKAELAAEIATLNRLEIIADHVRKSNRDKKWDELSRLLQTEQSMLDETGRREKLIIFTEHRDTLNYLNTKIQTVLGIGSTVVIHGGLKREARHQAEADFKNNPDIMVMIATDAAGEGINLQRAHLMINYDLPWNPNRLEQRFGRIHRIGQKSTCFLWNLVAKDTREGMVFLRLFEKLEIERQRLGGKVFDILGKVTFNNKPLRDLLIEAIQIGDSPEAKAHFNQVIDGAFDREKIEQLLRERALTNEAMNDSCVHRIREEMEEYEARKLQPYFIESFFKSAFRALKGEMSPILHSSDHYMIRHVPREIKEECAKSAHVEAIAQKYEEVSFDISTIDDNSNCLLLSLGEPLLDAVVSLTLKNGAETLDKATVMVDHNDYSFEPHLLLYIENKLTTVIDGKENLVCRTLDFVNVSIDGTASKAGFAPYLDLDIPNADELNAVRQYIQSAEWLNNCLEERARQFAMIQILRPLKKQVLERQQAHLDKTEAEVKSRLLKAISYWDNKTNTYEEDIQNGKKVVQANLIDARQRADNLRSRLKQRMSEISSSRTINAQPPKIAGCVLVIPAGMMKKICGSSFSQADADAKKKIELIGMNRVMEIERQLGHVPTDVSRENRGYDIASHIGEYASSNDKLLRFIEVKSRTASADTVTLSHNEILTARNVPEQFILAVVKVDGDIIHTTYYGNMKFKEPDNGMAAITYNIGKLRDMGDIVYEG